MGKKFLKEPPLKHFGGCPILLIVKIEQQSIFLIRLVDE